MKQTDVSRNHGNALSVDSPNEAPGLQPVGNTNMNQTIEADVDATGTDCPCCGDQMDAKGLVCSDCRSAGCDPASGDCQRGGV